MEWSLFPQQTVIDWIEKESIPHEKKSDSTSPFLAWRKDCIQNEWRWRNLAETAEVITMFQYHICSKQLAQLCYKCYLHARGRTNIMKLSFYPGFIGTAWCRDWSLCDWGLLYTCLQKKRQCWAPRTHQNSSVHRWSSQIYWPISVPVFSSSRFAERRGT